MTHHHPTRRWQFVAGALVALALTLMAFSASAEQVIDRIVAQVNDEIITLYELEEAAAPYMIERGMDPSMLDQSGQRSAILEEVLDDMVDRILVEQEARQQGIQVSDEEIDQVIAQMARQQNMTPQQFRQVISQYGIEFEEYREILRFNRLQMYLIQQRAGGGGVSESDVEAMYRERYGSPDELEERIEVRHILLIPDQFDGGEKEATDRALEMRDKIVTGEATFGELAERYSQGPGADDGGNIGTFGPGELDESFERAAFAQEVGVVSEPVHTDFGIHLIEVVDAEQVEDPDVERRKEQIRAQLQQREMERRLDSYLETLRTRAFVDVRY